MGLFSFLFIFVGWRIILCGSTSVVVENIRPLQLLRDGTTMVSSEGTFEMGFFSPGSSSNRYLGIWYRNIPVPTVVWVANRCKPMNKSSGSLTLNNVGNLVLLGENNSVVWSTNSSKQAGKPIVELLDNGNLVLRDEKDENNKENYLWQSFDYPCDTLLSGMKFGWDLKRGHTWQLSSWKSSDDPCNADFTYGMEYDKRRHTYPESIIRKGSEKFYRTGPWNGLRYSGYPELRPNALFDYRFVYSDDEVYYSYTLKNKSRISRIVINQTTSVRQRWIWMEAEKYWKEYYKVPRDQCDYYGQCGANAECIISGNPICQCLKGFKPKSPQDWSSMDWSKGCERISPLMCQEKEKDGFMLFSGWKLPDAQNTWVNKSMNLRECRAKCLSNCSCTAYTNSDIRGEGSGCVVWFGDLYDIRQFPSGGQDLFVRISAAEIVYQEKARAERKAKRAVIIMAVLIGLACGMILIGLYIRKWRNFYDQSQGRLLTWPKRFQIVCGIAKGLSYLHHDSRLRIIHRDLKASNVLLDEAMNPKISDFGLARSFGGDQLEGNTNKVVGTYGYMAPEYAFGGLFSIKSDVFSFGILMLEIISGKKSIGFCYENSGATLIGYAWTLMKENNAVEFIDKCLIDSYHSMKEVLRCIHIGLLCVQQNPVDRPNMSSVVTMLSGEGVLPQPKPPGYFTQTDLWENHSPSSKLLSSCTFDTNITDVEAR
ncbi:G-type lectin S-receptor-like serine/threonine-protein kinase At4g27290 isoform X2 [Humulus lupulus]|uniref:G-type lectin S-receptor-like serine/threonine-protein kinase At4g27290 isoform X2 n=1 Tax=Humulus lupulus TaxID=3486 RepID=UPI002B40463B|nr:G-type lectin S-receptor-like serine/threonine-protein kinase At4g27290 isoform X2 [Humulus lupulus]